jgi:hypothetical protein
MSMQDCVEVHLQVCSSFFYEQNGLHIRWFAQQPSGESNSHSLTAAQLAFFCWDQWIFLHWLHVGEHASVEVGPMPSCC